MLLLVTALAAQMQATQPILKVQNPGAPASTKAMSWANCSAVLVLKAVRMEDKALAALVGPMARSALAQAKATRTAADPSERDLEVYAMQAASGFNKELAAGDPKKLAQFEALVTTCMERLAALPA